MNPLIIIVSNVYFVSDVVQNSEEHLFRLELDENSCGGVVLMVFKLILRVDVDEEYISLENIENIYCKLYRFYLNRFCVKVDKW